MYIKKASSLITLVIFFICFFTNFTFAAEPNNGVILGHVYDYDGSTPISGAVVKIKNSSSGTVYESTVSDTKGMFSILGIESGIYQYSVSMPGGDFIADDVFGVKVTENDTAKISINVIPYEKKVDSAVIGTSPAPVIEGETFIGRVVDFDEATSTADIFVMQGVLQKNDKIHALGEKTNFYQKVVDIIIEDSEVKKVNPGQTATLNFHHEASVGDAVYVADRSGSSIIPFVLAPAVGVATIVGGSKFVAYKMGVEVNETVVATSAFKNKK